ASVAFPETMDVEQPKQLLWELPGFYLTRDAIYSRKILDEFDRVLPKPVEMASRSPFVHIRLGGDELASVEKRFPYFDNENCSVLYSGESTWELSNAAKTFGYAGYYKRMNQIFDYLSKKDLSEDERSLINGHRALLALNFYTKKDLSRAETNA